MKELASKLPSWFDSLSDFEQKKLLSDRFYLAQAKAGNSYQSLLASGWLNHAYSLEEMIQAQKSFYTPFEHYAGENKEIFILLNTGSYAPAHMGHISLLKRAKEKIVELGLSTNPVMVLSPSHDKYVLTKSSDILEWNINKRMEQLSNVVNNYPYKNEEDVFIIDPWEAVYCEYPVNFTDVINKYILDLESLGINYKIGYVFGSDNEQFLDAFSQLSIKDKSKFYAICVEREGYPTQINSKAENVLYVENNDEFSILKSRDIRKNPYVNLVESENNFDNGFCYNKNGFYAVRNDSYIALKHWIKNYPEKEIYLKNSFNEFHEELKALIKEFTKIDVKSIDLDEQRNIVEELGSRFKCINLDVGTNDIKNMYPLDYGRIFIPSSLQNKPIKMVIRPEAENKEEVIPSGDYVFIDDDIASGTTLKLIQKILLKDGISFKKYVNLAQKYFEQNGVEYKIFDIVDTKDFLLGSHTGGLICEVHGKSLRLPYFTKYINLHTRANIAYSDMTAFNKKLLKINQEFFDKNPYLKLKDINKDLANFMFKGLSRDVPIYEIIKNVS